MVDILIHIQEKDVIAMDAPTRGMKRNHESESSNLDKEQASFKNFGDMKIALQIVTLVPPRGGWIEVKKKKGKKGKIEDF